MDIAETNAKKHILVIVDRFSGYVWAQKTEDKDTGTSNVIIDKIHKCLGTGILFKRKIKWDQGTNLISAEIRSFLKPLRIEVDT